MKQGRHLPKPFVWGWGVFSVATHTAPLPGADTACFGSGIRNPTMEAAYHTAAGLNL
jgi:hypothetical protein